MVKRFKQKNTQMSWDIPDSSYTGQSTVKEYPINNEPDAMPETVFDDYPDYDTRLETESNVSYESELEPEPVKVRVWHEIDYRYIYFCGVVLLIVGFGLMFLLEAAQEVHASEELNLTVAYALGK
jgi:hypothetical protein